MNRLPFVFCVAICAVTSFASVPRQGTVRFVPTVLVFGGAQNFLADSDWREPQKKYAPTCTASVGTGGPTNPAAVARRAARSPRPTRANS